MLSTNARTVLEKRYLVKDQTGKPTEQPEEMFWRVATTVADADRRYGASDGAVQTVSEDFYRLMTERRFEPNSPTLMNAGRPLGQLSACFVLPVADALANGKDGIYDTLKAMAIIHQSGGGTGFGFSRIRPKGSMVRSTTGVASGPVSFMQLYDASTDAVKQGGTRRGANMGILRVDHPNILEFITCKEDITKITNFNISVAVTDVFMAAVKAGTTYELKDPRNGAVVGELDANTVWEKMIQGAWRTGEPGCFFVDEANRYNPVPHLGSYEATNPCGEQPLLGRVPARHPSLDALSRQHHRRQPVSPGRDRHAVEADPPDRAGRDGICGRARAARYRVRFARGGRVRTQGDGVRGHGGEAGERAPGTRAGRVPRVGAVDLGSG
jgi:ribonucleoside-diphosphate reductase alpha chain